VIAASPLTFKNQIFDQGRPDIFGLIFLEGIVLAVLAERPRTALAIATIGILPVSLIHEGQLLLFVPAALALLAAQGRAACPWKALALPIAVFAASLAINWALPSPDVPYSVYHAYLRSKSLEPFAFTHDRFLYDRLAGGHAFVVSELRRLGRFQFAARWDYLAAGATLAAVAFSLLFARGSRPPPRRRFLLSLSLLAPGYLILFWLASDWARWVADFGFCFLLLALVFAVRHRLRPALAGLLAVAALQVAGSGPFGIEVPQLCLGYRAASLLGVAASPAATAYARRVAHERGVLSLSHDHDFVRAVGYFRQAVSIQPNASDYAYLGIALVRDHQPARGAVALETALRLDPRLVMARYYLGSLLLEQPGRFADGLAQLHAALTVEPGCPPVLRLLARVNARRPVTVPRRPHHKRVAAIGGRTVRGHGNGA
jgi:tetratricopeptide (TPR) repeat protein